MSRRPWWRIVAATSAVLALVAGLARVVADLRATRPAVATLAALVAAESAGDLDRAWSLCSARFLRANPRAEGARPAGLRSIHPNFRAWRDGGSVLICPTNRIGPVYRLVAEGGRWAFDGPAGWIGAGGRVEAGEGGENP